MSLALPLGIDDFAKIRNDGFYYVDKTAFIRELLATRFEANLITRPPAFREVADDEHAGGFL